MTKITAYKGFNADMTCRDYQFEIGKTYQHEGAVEICSSGFHACEYPLDVFCYYEPANHRFAEVEVSGDIAHEAGSGKREAANSPVAQLPLRRNCPSTKWLAAPSSA
ncbi:DUF7666 domain-containing protein [Candidatus Sodalis pierantonius]|uniref:DUF7666 domain-containing protein n=1 Tax=Candidatus Sodalis pierantonii TaxID=1486991 RepID=UPI00046CCBE9|nr:hypothetical protein [Candidatus Sodalis pierantonius]